jgi:hypothetical protein
MVQVLQNIYAVGRQAQVLPHWHGPKLGVTFTVSLKQQEERRAKRALEKQQESERYKRIEQEELERRQVAEDKAESRKKARMSDEEGRATLRRTRRGFHDKNSIRFRQAELERFDAVKFGMDAELERSMEDNYDLGLETALMDWVEAVTQEPVDYFYESLKSGVILCKLINCIRPNMIRNIHERGVALQERENIKNYLRACEALGVKKTELFIASDLYDRKSMLSVLNNVHSLARVASNMSSFTGPRFDRLSDYTDLLTSPRPADIVSKHTTNDDGSRAHIPAWTSIFSQPTTTAAQLAAAGTDADEEKEKEGDNHGSNDIPSTDKGKNEDDEFDEAMYAAKLAQLTQNKKGGQRASILPTTSSLASATTQIALNNDDDDDDKGKDAQFHPPSKPARRKLLKSFTVDQRRQHHGQSVSPRQFEDYTNDNGKGNGDGDGDANGNDDEAPFAPRATELVAQVDILTPQQEKAQQNTDMSDSASSSSSAELDKMRRLLEEKKAKIAQLREAKVKLEQVNKLRDEQAREEMERQDRKQREDEMQRLRDAEAERRRLAREQAATEAQNAAEKSEFARRREEAKRKAILARQRERELELDLERQQQEQQKQQGENSAVSYRQIAQARPELDVVAQEAPNLIDMEDPVVLSQDVDDGSTVTSSANSTIEIEPSAVQDVGYLKLEPSTNVSSPVSDENALHLESSTNTTNPQSIKLLETNTPCSPQSNKKNTTNQKLPEDETVPASKIFEDTTPLLAHSSRSICPCVIL